MALVKDFCTDLLVCSANTFSELACFDLCPWGVIGIEPTQLRLP